jgi:hypothetical protein
VLSAYGIVECSNSVNDGDHQLQYSRLYHGLMSIGAKLESNVSSSRVASSLPARCASQIASLKGPSWCL